MNDADANKLVLDNIGLAHDFASRNSWRCKSMGIDIEELKSAVTYALVRASRAYDPDRAAFSTFAWAFMRRQCINMWMASRTCKRNMKITSLLREDGTEIPVPDERLDPSLWAESAEAGRRLEGAMSKLTDDERFVLTSRYFGDKTLNQVGESMGISGERVRQIEARAIRRCRAA